MQDFTKNQHFKPISEQPKKGFIKSRLNKDNFWNLIFAFGMMAGMGLIFILAPKAPIPWPIYLSIMFWVILLAVPLTVKHFARVNFIDGKFFNSQGKKLDIPKQVPNLFLMIVTIIVLIISTGAIADKLAKSYPDELINLVFFPIFLASLFFTPAVFFIIKNCPITILFNYQFYKQNIQPATKISEHKETDWTHDPSKCNIAGNIYYDNHNYYHTHKHK